MTDLLSPEFLALQDAVKGRYSLERELGRGGMALVYLAHDFKHDRKVAIKVLQPEIATALGAPRFLREIGIAARLNHPHILPLHDSGEADGMLYYVMPFVEGESLREKLRCEKALSLEETNRWPAAVNIGPNPTFGEKSLKVEAHLIGFSQAIYGRPIEVDFLSRVRDIHPFGSVEELKQQLSRDVARVKQEAAGCDEGAAE